MGLRECPRVLDAIADYERAVATSETLCMQLHEGALAEADALEAYREALIAERAALDGVVNAASHSRRSDSAAD